MYSKALTSDMRLVSVRPLRLTKTPSLKAMVCVSLLIALALTFSFPLPAYAANITVDEVNCTLADAITAANNDAATGGCPAGSGADTIILQTDVTLSSALPGIASDITIEGNGHTINGNNAVYHILKVTSGGNLTLNNATITGGNANGSYPDNHGGGIYFSSGNGTLNNSVISGNSASGYGGGIYAYAAIVVLNNSIVSDNSASVGGGIAVGVATVTLSNSTISSNSASSGGGIYLVNSGGSVTLSQSTVSSNSATSTGGGIFALYGDATLVNSTVSGNSASSSGGGIAIYRGNVTLENSTISGNSASSGGGIYGYNTGTATLRRSIVSGNSPNEVYRSGSITVSAADYNLFGHSGLTNAQAFSGFTPSGTDITATSDGSDPTALADILNPMLALNGGQTKTHSLVAGSPALDAIPPASCGGLTTDQRGATRPANTNCDIGAFELQSTEVSNYASSVPATNIGGTNVSVTQVNSGSPGQVNVLKRASVYPGGSQDAGEFPIIWVLTATGALFDVNLRLCYTEAELAASGVTDESTITAYRRDETTGSWEAQTTNPDPANNCVDVSNVTAFSPWTLSGDGGSPTVVTLQSFSAQSGRKDSLVVALIGVLAFVGSWVWARRRRVAARYRKPEASSPDSSLR